MGLEGKIEVYVVALVGGCDEASCMGVQNIAVKRNLDSAKALAFKKLVERAPGGSHEYELVENPLENGIIRVVRVDTRKMDSYKTYEAIEIQQHDLK